MSDLTVGRVAELIQGVDDAVHTLLRAAIFPDRLTAEDGPDPRYARYPSELPRHSPPDGRSVRPMTATLPPYDDRLDDLERDVAELNPGGAVAARLRATPLPAPDTRPRCGGTPGKPGMQEIVSGCRSVRSRCTGCADCDQPAPTPSGEVDARPTTIEKIERQLRGDTGMVKPVQELLDDLKAAIRAESADALQEARENQRKASETATMAIDRAERLRMALVAAEERLREVEGALLGLADLWEAHANSYPEPSVAQSAVLLCARQLRETIAASRPVPAALTQEEAR